ncbi:MAG: aldo/keto reductase [Elainellaceae cyanobacterium]
MHHIRVNNFSMPALGLGTYQLEGNVALRIVKHALKVGYRHLDTAQMYGNEAEGGRLAPCEEMSDWCRPVESPPIGMNPIP